MMTFDILPYKTDPAVMHHPCSPLKTPPIRLSYEYSGEKYTVWLLIQSLEQEDDYHAAFLTLHNRARAQAEQVLLVDLKQERFFYQEPNTAFPNKVASQSFTHHTLCVQLSHYMLAELRDNFVTNDHYLTSLAGNLTACLINLLKQPSDDPVSITPFQLRRIKEYVEEHMEHLITLNELADLVKLSSFHFARQFKQATKETPYQYVTRLKMQYAKHQLLNTKASVIDIGMQVGYDNPSHFSRAFKRTLGISPTNIRKSL